MIDKVYVKNLNISLIELAQILCNLCEMIDKRLQKGLT